MAQQIIIGVVVVSYNSASELEACVNTTLAAAEHAGAKPIMAIVDNNSKDGSADVARKLGAEVIANDYNAGFAKAVNQGIHLAYDKGATHILILNPDAALTLGCLSAMLDMLAKTPKAGAIGPNMVDNAGKSTTDGYYQKAPSWISIALFSTILRPYALKSKWLSETFYNGKPLNGDQTVEQIPGACILTSKELLDKIGLLDEDFAIWFEDVEWCYRARKKGFELWFCDAATAIHEGGVSFEKWQSLDKAVTFYVSMKTFFKKHKPLSYFMVLLVLSMNSIILYLKSRDRSNLVFLKRFLKQKRGILPS
jgi:N-acetylglucosaminyl-diphospho-decaprenol L-rhamnosyltransferase